MLVRFPQPVSRREPRLSWLSALLVIAALASVPAFAERTRSTKTTGGDPLSETARAEKLRATAEAEKRPVATVDTKAVLTQAFEQRARELLERYIPVREFQVSVQVTATNKAMPLTPYDPSGIILSRSTEELSAYVQRVDIEILLTSRLASTKNRLQQLLFKELELNQRRGDRVKFGDLGIEIDNDSWRQEKNDLKNNMDRLKAENDRLARELARSNQQEGFLGKWTLWAVIGVIIAVFGTILIALFLAGRSLSNAGKTMAGAVAGIASAVESAAGAVGAGPSNAPAAPGSSILEGKLITDGGGKSGGSGLASLPMESLQAHFGKLRVELLESVNENTESVILRQLTNLLSNPATVGRAVVTLELLGRDMATEMFKRLGINSQEAILKFMREGSYDKPKVEMMLEAGEELKTKLLVDSLDMARGRPSEKVAEKVLQLTDEDLVNVSNELTADLMPRFFLYLDATKIAMLLSSLKANTPKNYQKVLTLLSKMPDAEKTNNQDAELGRGIDNILNRTKSDAQRPFLKVYKEIIEAAEDDLSEDIVRELSVDPRLDSYFRENVITIRTFFKLNEESRNEIVETLSNKDVAALALGVRDDERKIIMQGLPARRKGMIAEEFESLSSRGGRQAQYAFKRVRDTIVKKLSEMKEQGMLASVLKKDESKGSSKPAVGSGGGGGGGGAFGKKSAENTGATNTGTQTGINRAGATAAPAAPGLKPLNADAKAQSPAGTPPKPPVKKTG